MQTIKRHVFLAVSITCSTFFLVHCEAPPATNTHNKGASSAIIQDSSGSVSTIDEQTETINSLKKRLFESYSRYWPHISSEYQHEQLPSVLNDPLPELRTFGVERVAVLLRDGDATDEELQLVVDKLRDTNATVRLAAAQLLPEMDVPGLPDFVANSLTKENDIRVIDKELSYFRTHPSPVAIMPTISLLSATPDGSAAETLAVLLDSFVISDETSQKIVRDVKRLRRTNSNPTLITLEAMLGDNNDKRKLIRLLDSKNEDVRSATAKGFASAGFADPLITRAHEPALYEYALIALQKHFNIEAFKQLMILYKPNNESWDLSAFEIATHLNTSELLRADDMLKRLDRNDVRLLVLQALWDRVDEKGIGAQKAIARRIVPLMIETGNAVSAVQLLDRFGETNDEGMLTLRFNTAISAAAWDTAADARPDPAPWIYAWQQALENDPTTAAVISQQITLRFEDKLTPAQLKTLGIVQVDATNNSEQQ